MAAAIRKRDPTPLHHHVRVPRVTLDGRRRQKRVPIYRRVPAAISKPRRETRTRPTVISAYEEVYWTVYGAPRSSSAASTSSAGTSARELFCSMSKAVWLKGRPRMPPIVLLREGEGKGALIRQESPNGEMKSARRGTESARSLLRCRCSCAAVRRIRAYCSCRPRRRAGACTCMRRKVPAVMSQARRDTRPTVISAYERSEARRSAYNGSVRTCQIGKGHGVC